PRTTSPTWMHWPSVCWIFNTTGNRRRGRSNGNSLDKTSPNCSRSWGISLRNSGPRIRDRIYETVYLVTYIRSIARRDTTPVTGDAIGGAKLFWGKGGCGQCHRIGIEGGRLGPDLTRAGRQRSFAYLRESVLNPNEDLTPGLQHHHGGDA